MARIRSIHPGQWSDEDFVALSVTARLLALALRNIADDQGVFEWKPITIKMQLMPADNIDVAPLLSELVGNNVVVEFEAEGKRYGAIRNFMKWQRPKKPAYQHPITEPVRDYVGFKKPEGGTEPPSSGASSPPVPHQFRTGSEITQQRKEEGGRREEKEAPSGASKKRASRLPDDWTPSAKLIEWAEGESLSPGDVRREAEKFRDHWHASSGRNATKLDWGKAFQNWIRNAVDGRKPRGKRPDRNASGDLTNDFMFARG